jgi:hypothetical protein
MATSLLDWIVTLLKDTEAREAFQQDPKAAMSAAGMSSICGSDIRDARPFLLDNPSVKQVKPYEQADTSSAKEPSEQIRQIVENHKIADSDRSYVSHGGPRKETEIEDSYQKYADDSYNRYSDDDVQDNDEVTGPASGVQSSSADQGGSTVGNDQYSLGGRENVLGNGNDQSVNQNDNSADRNGNEIQGDRNAGRDFNFEQGGAVFGQGVAGGDIDHVGGLIGAKDVVDVGNVNVLNVANINDILNGSLNELANNVLNDSPFLTDVLTEGIHDLDLQNVLQNGLL